MQKMTLVGRSAGVALVCAVLASAWETACMAGPPEHVVGGKTAEEVFRDPRLVALARAACDGDVAAVDHELRSGADPNGKGVESVTPLLWAENCGNLQGMEALLKAGANPNIDITGFTPVCIAAGTPNPALLKLLLRYRGNPNAVYQRSPWTALRVAFGIGMERKGWENYYALLNAGADVNLVHEGHTIADFAASMNQYDKVAELLERGYNHDLMDLGRYVTIARMQDMEPKQQTWATKVKAMLEQRGVHFPVPAPSSTAR